MYLWWWLDSLKFGWQSLSTVRTYNTYNWSRCWRAYVIAKWSVVYYLYHLGHVRRSSTLRWDENSAFKLLIWEVYSQGAIYFPIALLNVHKRMASLDQCLGQQVLHFYLWMTVYKQLSSQLHGKCICSVVKLLNLKKMFSWRSSIKIKITKTQLWISFCKLLPFPLYFPRANYFYPLDFVSKLINLQDLL